MIKNEVRFLSFGLAVTALLLSGSARASVSPFIVGGDDARPGEFPSIVQLVDDDGKNFCGGTLVRPTWVLTAAHCVSGEFHVLTGANSGDPAVPVENIDVVATFVHPDHRRPIADANDFALLKLARPSKSAALEVNKASLVIPDDEDSSPIAVTAGWGATKEIPAIDDPDGDDRATAHDHLNFGDTLRRVDVRLVSAKRCESAYPKRIDSNSMICAGFEKGERDSCDGDSGGPLILNLDGRPVLIGVVSWGDGCARPHAFGVYGRVDTATSWIEQTIATH